MSSDRLNRLGMSWLERDAASRSRFDTVPKAIGTPKIASAISPTQRLLTH
ncbi:hypothetical protein [Telmatocola sphagniphila]|nr:hypothetical protein [Telmatocola sphagniphila]